MALHCTDHYFCFEPYNTVDIAAPGQGLREPGGR